MRYARIGTMGYRDMLLYGTQYEGYSLRGQLGVEVEPLKCWKWCAMPKVRMQMRLSRLSRSCGKTENHQAVQRRYPEKARYALALQRG